MHPSLFASQDIKVERNLDSDSDEDFEKEIDDVFDLIAQDEKKVTNLRELNTLLDHHPRFLQSLRVRMCIQSSQLLLKSLLWPSFSSSCLQVLHNSSEQA